MLLIVLALVLSASAGCGGDDSNEELPECTNVDDTTAVLVAGTRDGTVVDIVDQGDVDLIPPPQGGHILLVGARVRSARDCRLDATGALRDPATQRVLGLEQRPLLLEHQADGWAVPGMGLASMPNVAVCPSAAATTSVAGNLYALEVRLADFAGNTVAELRATIRPTCGTEFCLYDCEPAP